MNGAGGANLATNAGGGGQPEGQIPSLFPTAVADV